MSLLNNAAASLKLALEDFAAKDAARLLSATRNLHAGILLLFKEKLRLLSPPGTDDVLIKQKILPKLSPASGIIFVGVGKKTVDGAQIGERFNALGITTDWKRFKNINDLRNDIEHLYTKLSQGAIRGMISDTFIIIRDFIQDELKQDPKDILGDDAWNTLLSVSEVYEKERADCEKALRAIDWKSDALEAAVLELKCNECGSALLFPVGRQKGTALQCRSCGEDEQFENYAERAISDHFASDNHYSYKDGGDPASITCPHCGAHAFIVEENWCVICGESCERTCARCSSTIPIEELSDSSYCGYCEHMMSKDD